MSDSPPEFHLYEDLCLTPAYVLGYAFHALGRLDRNARIHGRRGAQARHSRVVFGGALPRQFPQELRWEISEACRALDAHWYTAAVFHLPQQGRGRQRV